jgi:SAM-dependent methyltransferase
MTTGDKNNTCRACFGPLGAPFLSLGVQPLSNSYLSAESLHGKEPAYPLDLFRCGRCGLVQIPGTERAADIFNESYAYFSSYSTTWLDHCRRYADMITARLGLCGESRVIEIASNDGYLLQYFRKKDIPVLGIEPAAATARAAREKGIPTEVCFFDVPCALRLAASGGKADLIIGNNVLAHNPDLRGFAKALPLALKPEGVVTLEFPHLARMLENGQFDTVYHEHYSYLSLMPLVPLFEEFGLKIFDVEELPTHGGSLRVYASHKGSERNETRESVGLMAKKEKTLGLDKRETYEAFAKNAEETKKESLAFLEDAKNRGKSISGYGAPAKGNTFLNYCGIATDLLPFTVDLNPHKQGKFLPGSHIPVYSPEKIQEAKPDFVFILPWNIKEEIMRQMAYIREWGGKFVVAIPKLEIF